MNERLEEFHPNDLECRSIEAMVQYLMDNYEEHFDYRHISALKVNLRMSANKVRAALEEYGLKMRSRRREGKEIRTIGSNPHDRWYGPGSSRTHGGSGWEQILGRAGQKG